MIPAAQAVGEVHHIMRGRAGFLVGSAVAGMIYDREYTDVDVFVPSLMALSSNTEYLLGRGAVMVAEEQRKWNRWNVIDAGDWDTNSIKLELPSGIEVNLIHKRVGKSPLTTIEAVLGSFDFGYVGMGYDLRTDMFHDGREFWFGKTCDFEHLGLLPQRALQWRNASLSRFTGVRQGERFAKFAARGYDMWPSVPPLVDGYRNTAAHYLTKEDPEYTEYAPLYLALADLIAAYDIDALLHAYKGLVKHDPVASLTAGLP